MGRPIIWSGVNAKLINSGDLIDSKNNSLTNGDKITVTQASHGFTSSDVGRPLYLVGGTWTLAIASAAASAEVAGFIYAVLDANTLRISTSGQCPTVGANFLDGGGSLVAGEVYFLSPTTAGKVTATEPTVIGQISKPLGIATSTTSFQFFNFRGSVVGGANARTQISLSNNTTANVQDVSAYDAGEIVGWVYIDAGTDYRFLLKAQFAKNGAGTNWNLSYQTVGDTPPAGFSFSITSGGVIQYTMPSVASFSSALFNYALNAPAVGTSFPLSLDSINLVNTGITGATGASATAIVAGGSGKVGEILTFTDRTVTGVLNNIASNTNALTTLTAGIWLIQARCSFTPNTSLTNIKAYVATNSTADFSGGVAYVDMSYTNTSSTETTSIFLPPLQIMNVSSSQALYAKSYSGGVARDVTLKGFAIRIA